MLEYLAMVVGDNELTSTKIAGKLNFDCHGDAAVQRRAHPPIDHILCVLWWPTDGN